MLDLNLSIGTYENDEFQPLADQDVVALDQEIRVALTHGKSRFTYVIIIIQ